MTDNIIHERRVVPILDEDAVVPAGHTVDPVLAEHAAEIHRVGKRFKERAIEDVIEIGRHLAEAEEHVGHGNRGAYLAWIKTEFGWSDQTARRFIHIYEFSRDSKFNNLLNSDLPLSGLYQLAAPKTPDEARQEIAERVEAGKRPSYAEVKKTIAEAKRTKGADIQEIDSAEDGKTENVTTENVTRFWDWKTGQEAIGIDHHHADAEANQHGDGHDHQADDDHERHHGADANVEPVETDLGLGTVWNSAGRGEPTLTSDAPSEVAVSITDNQTKVEANEPAVKDGAPTVTSSTASRNAEAVPMDTATAPTTSVINLREVWRAATPEEQQEVIRGESVEHLVGLMTDKQRAAISSIASSACRLRRHCRLP
ncbi:MAG: DUF3102 domain-containing protein [Xanthobacteraceae bacterium]